MSPAAVPSPCVEICRLDPKTGLCVGCLRTGDEIAAWGAADDDAKREILERVKARVAKTARPPQTPSP